MVKRPKRLISLTLVALMLASTTLLVFGTFSACTGGEKPAPTAEPTAPVSDAPTAQPQPAEAPTAEPGVPCSNTPAEQNEIKVSLPSGGSNDCHSYRFNELPAYDKAKEASYTFSGTRIHLCAYQALSAGFYNYIDGRNVCDAADHAYVSGVISSLDFTAHTLPGEQLFSVPVRLFITVEGDDGAENVYIVGDDLRVMRADKAYPYEEFPCSAITAISSEPLDDEQFRHLAAITLHYMDSEIFIADLLSYYLDGYRSAAGGTSLELAFGDTKKTFTDAAEINGILERFGLFGIGELAQVRCTHEYPSDPAEGAITATFTSSLAKEGLTIVIMPDGAVAFQVRSFTLGTGEPATPDHNVYANALLNAGCVGAKGKIPFEELRALILG
ncbi:MAG: PT domain-containing protein [Clostridia bacterium]|nr:PT domain-containing protein [Clostridia bacterium]